VELDEWSPAEGREDVHVQREVAVRVDVVHSQVQEGRPVRFEFGGDGSPVIGGRSFRFVFYYGIIFNRIIELFEKILLHFILHFITIYNLYLFYFFILVKNQESI
jgi:hypothetical protein